MLHNKSTIFSRINLDGLGIAASLVCAIHCAVLPLLFTSIPLMGIDIIKNKAFEYGMIGLAFVIGSYALYHGYRKHHHRLIPFSLLIVGFVFLFLKEALPKHHVWMVIPALVFIIAAHFSNYQYCKKAKHCHADDCNH
ncbi:MAG: MerC domain-containing protein [Bacteroidota bacterium]